jgi:transcriptional regulator with XRE-family HTH domain
MSTTNLYVDLGQRIRAFRKAKHITLQTLSKEVNRSIATLSKYETGEIAIGIDALVDICTYLGVDASMLLPSTLSVGNSEDIATHPNFQHSIFLYWYNREDDMVREAVIENRKDSFESILYFDTAAGTDYHKSNYLYTGTAYYTDVSTEFLYTNVTSPHDKVFVRLPSFFKKEAQRTGIMSCVTTYYQNVTVKLVALETRIKDADSLKKDLIYSNEEIKTLRATNFFIIE